MSEPSRNGLIWLAFGGIQCWKISTCNGTSPLDIKEHPRGTKKGGSGVVGRKSIRNISVEQLRECEYVRKSRTVSGQIAGNSETAHFPINTEVHLRRAELGNQDWAEKKIAQTSGGWENLLRFDKSANAGKAAAPAAVQ